jgi:cobalt-zinc-cadmium efflux system membrane fusion protein
LLVQEGDVVEAGQALARIESRQPGNPPPVITLEAPIAGLVVTSHIRMGEPVEPEKELLDISNLNEVWAVARVPEHHAGLLAPGSAARIMVPALGKQVLAGEMLRLGTAADSASGTIDAVFRVANPGMRLRPGMRAEFEIVLSKRDDVLSVPREALQGGPANRHVFIKDFDIPNAFVRTPVRVGQTSGGMVEILSGLFPGDLVVTTGSYPLGFAGGGNVSLKAALDAAHGHEHNEDGTVKGGGGEGGGHAEEHGDEHGAEGGDLSWKIFSGVLFLLLVASLAFRKTQVQPS